MKLTVKNCVERKIKKSLSWKISANDFVTHTSKVSHLFMSGFNSEYKSLYFTFETMHFCCKIITKAKNYTNYVFYTINLYSIVEHTANLFQTAISSMIQFFLRKLCLKSILS